MKIRTLALLVGAALTVPGLAHAADSRAVIVLDASGSMWGRIDGEPKIEIARKTLKEVTRSMPAEVDLGLMTYGHRSKDDCGDIESVAAVGSSRADIGAAIDAIQPKGMTPLTGAIERAAAELRGHEGAASIVVVSDGKETCEGDPCAAARAAAGAEVDLRVHVVGFDVDEEEAAQLRCIAEAGNGSYFSASNAGDLADAMRLVEVAVQPPAPLVRDRSVLFHDTFDSRVLDPAWEIVNADPAYATQYEGRRIMVAKTVERGGTPVNLHLLPAFGGDYRVTIDGTIAEGARVGFGIFYWTDEQNNLEVLESNRSASFRKTLAGERVHQSGLRGEKVTKLRLEKRGPNFVASGSSDGGASWHELARHLYLAPGRVGIAAKGWGGSDTPAEFEEITVTRLR